MIIEKEDTTAKLNPGEETVLLAEICRKYDDFEDLRNQQLTDIKLVRNAIYLVIT